MDKEYKYALEKWGKKQKIYGFVAGNGKKKIGEDRIYGEQSDEESKYAHIGNGPGVSAAVKDSQYKSGKEKIYKYEYGWNTQR